jgi:hypothetical protein
MALADRVLSDSAGLLQITGINIRPAIGIQHAIRFSMTIKDYT